MATSSSTSLHSRPSRWPCGWGLCCWFCWHWRWPLRLRGVRAARPRPLPWMKKRCASCWKKTNDFVRRDGAARVVRHSAVAAPVVQAEQLMIEAMVQRLERRLKKSPEDAEGWAMLGRSYIITQRYAEASQAYA